MQVLGSYKSCKMLFPGLGTCLGGNVHSLKELPSVFYTLAAIVSVFFVWTAVRETKGKTLIEIAVDSPYSQEFADWLNEKGHGRSSDGSVHFSRTGERGMGGGTVAQHGHESCSAR